ncbi:unnamed protein product [Allacma fusca]|uniref:Uncharacterized protein n=1 Tax=Allacma fusca TaxID=39272 RepID=A0A8J2PUB2_9HEXA|nr:unnamed protein product [Allacma fusca]
MKYVILAAVVFAVALARPQEDDPAPAAPTQNVTILSSDTENDGKGGFKWTYETSDGSKAEQEGHTNPPGSDNPGEVIQGSYSYVGPDGKTYSISYIADQNGFQPKGDFLPTPPSDPNSPAALALSRSAARSAAPAPEAPVADEPAGADAPADAEAPADADAPADRR